MSENGVRDNDTGEAAEPVEPYSSPCSLAELEPAGGNAIGAEDLLRLLNLLLEGERAGARAINDVCLPQASPAARQSLQAVARDEGRFCLMLHRHIVRLGGTPSSATGSFFTRLAAVDGFAEQLQFLNRGQGWVVRKLSESLPRIGDSELRRDLRVMLAVHKQNIAHCETMLTHSPD